MKKLTHEDYLQKLKNKNIKVYPLSKYINSRSKILHKCTCGNEWVTTPNLVLSNKKCGCDTGVNLIHSNEEYLLYLNNNNINVVPLENYIGNKTKILHKCTCGNIWNVTPQGVKIGNKCGCCFDRTTKRLRNNSEYIKKLKLKNIDVIPLEEYKGHDTHILHKCTCGNEWNVRPTNVIKGHGCGCKKVNNYNGIETYRNRKTILYYIKVNKIFKVGLRLYRNYDCVTDNLIKGRFRKDIKNGYNIKILQTKIFEDGADAYLREQEILNTHDKYKYKYISEDMNNFEGYTELFYKNIEVIL